MRRIVFVIGLCLSIVAFVVFFISLTEEMHNPPALDYFYSGTELWERWLTMLLLVTNAGPFLVSTVATALVSRLLGLSTRAELAVFASVNILAMAAWWFGIAMFVDYIGRRKAGRGRG